MPLPGNTNKKPAAADGATQTVEIVSAGYARGAGIPWGLKMALKVAFAAMRLPYGLLSGLGIFKHGSLVDDVGKIRKSFDEHMDFYREWCGAVPEYCLELGPGDSVGHALSGMAEGIKGHWFVDVGDFASQDPAHYRAVYDDLCREKKFSFDQQPPAFDRAVILGFANSHYGSEGLHSLANVPNEKISLSYSNAVLEHIRRADFAAYMKELYRVHKPGSMSRHWVDLHDHLGGALNNMRFAPGFWESKAVLRAGFYTNRLTMAEMVKMAEDAGFKVEVPYLNKWPSLPTPRGKMHQSFRGKPEDELNVCTFQMVMTKA